MISWNCLANPAFFTMQKFYVMKSKSHIRMRFTGYDVW